MRQPIQRHVYKALHKPLTLCGVDRRLFLLALMSGAATFNLFYSFLAGLLMFGAIYLLAWVTRRDPRLLSIILRSSHLRTRYDAAKREPFEVVVG